MLDIPEDIDDLDDTEETSVVISAPKGARRKPVVIDHTAMKEVQAEVVRPKGECIDLPPYKDSGGRWRTTSLFLETFDWGAKDSNGIPLYEKFSPIFTLREHAHLLKPSSTIRDRYKDGLVPSIRELYLSYNDPTEYLFAEQVFHSTYHWKHLQTLDWFKPYLEEWRLCLKEKLRAIGCEALVKIAQGSDPKLGLQAAKWLAEEGFAQRRGKGRPSEVQVIAEIKKEATIEKIYLEDAERLGLEPHNKTPEPRSEPTLAPSTSKIQ